MGQEFQTERWVALTTECAGRMEARHSQHLPHPVSGSPGPQDSVEDVTQTSESGLQLNTILLLLFVTGCVLLGVIIKLVMVYLTKWRKRKEAKSFERKYSNV